MKRIMGLDIGTRTCGIALSDLTGIIAYGVETYRFKDGNYEALLNYLIEFVKKNDVNKIVVGLPKHMNGDLSEMAKIILEFKDKLYEATSLEIFTIDERLTTVVANKRLLDADLSRNKRKQVIDKMAAVVILQNFLDKTS